MPRPKTDMLPAPIVIACRQAPTDDAIIHEVLDRWHERKKDVPENRWRKAPAWMRSEGWLPRGFRQPTRLRIDAEDQG